MNQALLKAGASIRELNIVRRHLSAVKGGRLLQHCGGARVLSLIISDVPGNDLATIGSGLTAGDWSSFGDAVAVLKRRSVWGRAPEVPFAFAPDVLIESLKRTRVALKGPLKHASQRDGARSTCICAAPSTCMPTCGRR